MAEVMLPGVTRRTMPPLPWNSRLRFPPSQQLRAEALRFGDALHLDRDRVYGLLQLLEARIVAMGWSHFPSLGGSERPSRGDPDAAQATQRSDDHDHDHRKVPDVGIHFALSSREGAARGTNHNIRRAAREVSARSRITGW